MKAAPGSMNVSIMTIALTVSGYDDRAHGLRMADRELECDIAAHPVSDDDRPIEAEVIAEPAEVVGKAGHLIALQWRIASAMAAQIDGHGPMRVAKYCR
jgi:hypothetical protein